MFTTTTDLPYSLPKAIARTVAALYEAGYDSEVNVLEHYMVYLYKGDAHAFSRELEAYGLYVDQAYYVSAVMSDCADMIRSFDMDTRFGPHFGVDRLDRWESAAQDGLSPPSGVKDILDALPELRRAI